MNHSTYDEIPARGAHQQWWMDLTPEQRVIHSNRNGCEHKADILKWPEPLRRARSFDPYAHASHIEPHSIEKFRAGTCDCQTCIKKIGIWRGGNSAGGKLL